MISVLLSAGLSTAIIGGLVRDWIRHPDLGRETLRTSAPAVDRPTRRGRRRLATLSDSWLRSLRGGPEVPA